MFKKLNESFHRMFLREAASDENTVENDVIKSLERNLREVALTKLSHGITNIKDYEYAFQDTIESFFPARAWWEVTDCNIFWTLFETKSTDDTIDEIIKGIKPEFRGEYKSEEIIEVRDDADVEAEKAINAREAEYGADGSRVFKPAIGDDVEIKESKALKEQVRDFYANRFEDSIPRKMRYKYFDTVNRNDLYWVTQEFFNENDIEEFADAFKNIGFDKAYVTVRDLSGYDFEKDSEKDVFAIINKDGTYRVSDFLKKMLDKYNLKRDESLKESVSSNEFKIDDVVKTIDWLYHHNKNYTKEQYYKISDIYDFFFEADGSRKKINIQERNLTRSERYNRDMNRIFDFKREQDDKFAKFLKKNGYSDEQIDDLRNKDKLSFEIAQKFTPKGKQPSEILSKIISEITVESKKLRKNKKFIKESFEPRVYDMCDAGTVTIYDGYKDPDADDGYYVEMNHPEKEYGQFEIECYDTKEEAENAARKAMELIRKSYDTGELSSFYDYNTSSVMNRIARKVRQEFPGIQGIFNESKKQRKSVKSLKESNVPEDDETRYTQKDLILSDEEFADDDIVEETISDKLSDEYGFCHNGFEWERAKDGSILVWNIKWDLEEACKKSRKSKKVKDKSILESHSDEDTINETDNVREIYMKYYPNDELGLRIEPSITFADVLQRMKNKEDFYDIINYGDSIIRERIFDLMSKIYDVDYDYFYYLWLGKDVDNNFFMESASKNKRVDEFADEEEPYSYKQMYDDLKLNGVFDKDKGAFSVGFKEEKEHCKKILDRKGFEYEVSLDDRTNPPYYHFEYWKKPLKEDTVKQGNYWVNKGKEGTHGKFRTKKQADAQRKAMFAQGYQEKLGESLIETDQDFRLFQKEVQDDAYDEEILLDFLADIIDELGTEYDDLLIEPSGAGASVAIFASYTGRNGSPFQDNTVYTTSWMEPRELDAALDIIEDSDSRKIAVERMKKWYRQRLNRATPTKSGNESVKEAWADNWSTGTVIVGNNRYYYEAKVFERPSQFGIDGGNISKLYVKRLDDGDGRVVAHYDRGWDIKPADTDTEKVVKIIKKRFSITEDLAEGVSESAADKYYNRISEDVKKKSIQKPKHIKNEAFGDDMRVYMNTWANYNEYGADLSQYGINSLKDGWMTIDQALEFCEEHAEDEPFINDTDNIPSGLDIDEYSNAVETLEKLQELESLNIDDNLLEALIEVTGDIDSAIDAYESGDYEWYPGVDSYTDLAYKVIDAIGGLDEALGDRVSDYIDEDAMRRDYEWDVREMMRDDAEYEIKHNPSKYINIDEDDAIEKWVDDNFDTYMNSVIDDDIKSAQRGEIDLSNYFDYEQFGRDLSFDDYYLARTGAIRVF